VLAKGVYFCIEVLIRRLQFWTTLFRLSAKDDLRESRFAVIFSESLNPSPNLPPQSGPPLPRPVYFFCRWFRHGCVLLCEGDVVARLVMDEGKNVWSSRSLVYVEVRMNTAIFIVVSLHSKMHRHELVKRIVLATTRGKMDNKNETTRRSSSWWHGALLSRSRCQLSASRVEQISRDNDGRVCTVT